MISYMLKDQDNFDFSVHDPFNALDHTGTLRNGLLFNVNSTILFFTDSQSLYEELFFF